MTPDIVVTEGLTKRYGDFTALSDCSMSVVRGEVFGLLGPNGAGKTTLIRLLLGHLQPTSGQLSIDGIDPRVDGVELRKRVAYLPGDARLPRHMKGGAVLRFFADMHPSGNLDRSLEVAEILELNTRTRVAFMSTGMRQKLALAVVFGVDTPLLILDEPTANLDPTVRGNVLNLVMDAKRVGRTVMFSSHVLSEIEDTCDRVAFLRKGKLAHRLAMKDLYQRHRITALVDQAHANMEAPETIASRIHTTIDGQSVAIVTDGDLAPMLSWVDSLALSQVRIEPLGLRAVYDAVHTGQAVAL
ncbi:putative ABC transporter ATP-binding protein YbhF [Rubripirellula obstinata]|uniref:Putative ABC transporter ATP-binding protein YbhF n=2 Tax=Rubripirellula obstinata TaxID=406547 RepID=A0A5B1CD76_9BACT|nr:putative ABC transporter ATP-binding protein YbhF [Rubripirellula obstinata]